MPQIKKKEFSPQTASKNLGLLVENIKLKGMFEVLATSEAPEERSKKKKINTNSTLSVSLDTQLNKEVYVPSYLYLHLFIFCVWNEKAKNSM